MSAIAGIFRFNRLDRISPAELAELARGLERLGPDGGGEMIECEVGIAFRAFHTTPQSHLESQPLSREDLLFAFDGRLDNRKELCAILNAYPEETTTDADLAFFAYKRWGSACFSELEGDWAVSLWDRARKQLVLARDVFGVRRLFYRRDDRGITWSTALEPLVQTHPGSLHLDLEYISGYLYPRPPIEATPYQEIRACPPSSVMRFDSRGLVETIPYWNLNPHSKIWYKSDQDYERHFRELFQQAVGGRLRSDRPILAELSGGVDSSSIVCMADFVSAGQPSVPVETLSYFDPDEPNGDERPYIAEIEQYRNRPGHHISMAEFVQESHPDRFAPLPEDHLSTVPGFFSSSLRWDTKISEVQRGTNARIILSGLGGDELLGGVQYEAPELAECLCHQGLTAFFKSLFRWSVARNKTAFRLVRETVQLLRACSDQELLGAYEGGTLPWTLINPPHPGITLRSFASWKELAPWGLCAERIRFALAQQLSNTESPLIGAHEKRYPYLDRSLFVFLASIPRTQLLQPGKRRWLMRRALRGLVPDPVLFRRTKWFGYRRPLVALRQEQTAIERIFSEPWLSDGVILDASLLKRSFELALQGSTHDEMALISALAIEQWLRSLVRHVQIAMPMTNFKSESDLKSSTLVQTETTLAERR